MRTLGHQAIETAKLRGASYADIRIVHFREEDTLVRNGTLGRLIQSETLGYGVRVLADGAWGFASSSAMTSQAVQETAAKAVTIAKASARVMREKVRLSPEAVWQDVWTTPYQIDPFTVPIETKLDLLYRTEEALRRDPRISTAEANLVFSRTRIFFLSSEGADIEQDLLQSGGGYVCTAVDNGIVERRSFPDRRGGFASMGYEKVLSMAFLENADRVREEALALLSAPACPPGKRTLILDPTQMLLQIHESCGHASELDRVLGMEANYAGVSFLTPEKKGSFVYGSPIVNLVADMTLPGGMATRGYDDEGVRVRRFHVVKDGIFRNYFTSRELAHRCDEEHSNGCCRASRFSRTPIVRIPNLSLMPGEHTLDRMIAETEDGVLFETNKSWSIDQWRMNFQFATEIGWEIKGGQRGQMLRRCTYQGTTTEFWRSCDAIGDRDHWKLYGTRNCGKGQPAQRAAMSHGSSPARFQDVMVGVGNE